MIYIRRELGWSDIDEQEVDPASKDVVGYGQSLQTFELVALDFWE